MKKRLFFMLMASMLMICACSNGKGNGADNSDEEIIVLDDNDDDDSDDDDDAVTDDSDDNDNDADIDGSDADDDSNTKVKGDLFFDVDEAYTQDWQYAYYDILEQCRDERAYDGHSLIGLAENDIYEYSLYDVDKDTVPELLIKFGDCEADYRTELYRYNSENDEVEYLGMIAGGHSSLYSYPDGNGIAVDYGHMGYQFVTIVSINDDGSISSEDIFDEELDMSDIDSYYTPMSEIVNGSEYIDSVCYCLDMPLSAYSNNRLNTGDGLSDDEMEAIWEDVLAGDTEVLPVYSDHYRNQPTETMTMDELLEAGNADEYGSEASEILDYELHDLNGDGQSEIMADLSGEIILVLSVQEGNVYAYTRYGYGVYTIAGVDNYGVIWSNDTDSYNENSGIRFIFDKEQCYVGYVY